MVLAASYLAVVPVLAQPVLASPGAVSGGDAGAGLARQPPAAGAALPEAAPARDAAQWLTRLRQATNAPAYSGTYVVWSAPGNLASSRIWRVITGDTRVERVDALSGQPRSTWRITDRRGSHVETFLPVQRVLRIDRGDTPGGGGFPNLPDAGQGMSPADYYDARQRGRERVAGFMADVVQFMPRDRLRYGYRVWSEQRTGLAIKLQTLDGQGRVLEQAAFSGLVFDAPVSVAGLKREMPNTRGWDLQHVVRVPTTAQAEGWQIGGPAGQPVPGFALQHCYRHPLPVRGVDVPAGNKPASEPAPGGRENRNPVDGATPVSWFQCVFSDGLAAVSVFIEPDGAMRHETHHQGELDAALGGATHLLERRVGETGWLTMVGEVPPQTLKRFAEGVSRLP
jgi:sigma-E factor negative regulatory protein RseB